LPPAFGETRAGDVPKTHADIAAAQRDLGYRPAVSLKEGLRLTVKGL